MSLNKACTTILEQLTAFVDQINESDFCKPSVTLSNSTLGQHLRHTIEFFICFEQGYHKGVINYDKRQHDKLIERDKFIALLALNRITTFIQSLHAERELKLEVSYDTQQEDCITINTTATRELVYNIEHAVHHMAIMKIGIQEVSPYITLPSDFGIAVSTIRYQDSFTSASH